MWSELPRHGQVVALRESSSLYRLRLGHGASIEAVLGSRHVFDELPPLESQG